MKHLTVIALVLLGISLTVNWMQFQSRKDESLKSELREGRLTQTITRNEAEKLTALALVESERKSRSSDSLKYKSRENGLKSIIRVQRQTIRKTRPEISATLDSLPLVETFVNLQDSAIQNLDSLLAVQELACFEQAKSYSREIGHLNSALQAADSVGIGWREFAVSESKKSRKEKRRKRVWQVVSGILAGGIIYQSVK